MVGERSGKMRKYETVDSLFSGICDAIRAKDGTTDLINHQDIPERILGLSDGGGGGVNERYYIYKSGEEMNGHSMSIYESGSSSKKTDGWIYVHHYYAQVVASDLIQSAGRKRVGLTFLADATVFNHAVRITKFLLRDSAEVEKTAYDYNPAEGGATYFQQNIIEYPNTKNLRSGTVYFDIPEDVEEFYIVFSTVNVDFYIEEIWLE